MTRCLHDPEGGYYATRPRLGERGDFITAPMVSQMFGELIGLWCAEAWNRLGRPVRVIWAEIGPGDGTLMEDALRAGKAAPGWLEAAELWLVEPSAPLRALQEARLGRPSPPAGEGGGWNPPGEGSTGLVGEGPQPLIRPASAGHLLPQGEKDRKARSGPRWATSLAELPGDAPLILVANEVLDCLPARQFVRTSTGWAERMVGLGEDGGLAFGLARTPLDLVLPEAPEGAVVEVSAAQAALGAEIGARVARQGGAALLVDYGRDAPGLGDTLQAIMGHRKVDPLACPGEADLTVHADVPAVLAAARAQGAATSQVLTQGELLKRLGIEARAQALSRSRPDKAATIGRQLERLVGDGRMGRLFKAACIHAPGIEPPGLEAP